MRRFLSQNEDEPAFVGKRAHPRLRILRLIFSAVIDPLVARPLFIRMSCCPRENSFGNSACSGGSVVVPTLCC